MVDHEIVYRKIAIRHLDNHGQIQKLEKSLGIQNFPFLLNLDFLNT